MARVLVVEDNAVNMELMVWLLGSRGHEVVGARDAAEALAAIDAQCPALVLCDLQLPGMDGYQLLSRLRSDPATAGLRVVAVTAHAMPDDRGRVLAAGFDGYFAKPIDPETFCDAVDALLSGR